MTVNAVELTQALVRAETVTPDAEPALSILERELSALGAACTRLTFSAKGTPDVDNLFARIGTGSPHLAFAGHVDVVPTGPVEAWSRPPFSGAIADGMLHGRGATDMKSGIGCFIAAVSAYLETGADFGSISFIITGDEEGPSINGTEKLVAWMLEHGHAPDHCIVGEPASAASVGDRVRIGRRGSISGTLNVTGKQGHAAYPDLARNAVRDLCRIVTAITADPVDEGSPGFPPSNLEVTRVSTSNTATNVIPGEAYAAFNIRFNPSQSPESLYALLTERASRVATSDIFGFALDERYAAPFVTEDAAFLALIDRVTEATCGVVPERSTGGGTSDARFIAPHCPTVEVGLCAKTMHEVDERVPVADMEALVRLYGAILSAYFDGSADVA